ncbi:DNA polymerase III subunit theta [Serratia fonticola]|jgi:DNA polymerase-3 subunit theta|uniref:DNA polymerase III subunit theta n=1 Tax=Serratia fonticola TaxID=47917 RepID=UPI003AAA4118
MTTEKTSFNLANLSKEDMDKVNVDLAAGGVAFKERYNMPVIPELVEREQPEHLREYFRERLRLHREKAASLGRMEYTPPAQK